MKKKKKKTLTSINSRLDTMEKKISELEAQREKFLMNRTSDI